MRALLILSCVLAAFFYAILGIGLVTSAHAEPLSADAKRAGCSWSDQAETYTYFNGETFLTHIICPGPGTGLCWKRGHDPRKGEPALSTDNWKDCE
jgi:hypothetical protein